MLRSTFALVIVLFVKSQAFAQTDPLFLTPLISSGNISVARNLSVVQNLPNSSPAITNRTSYSGLITVNETLNSNLFFWFFPAIEDENAPLVLWLDGGPGLSNFLTIFTQNGPFSLEGVEGTSFTLEPRREDWTIKRSIIYLDSPVDVGFSFTNKSAGLPKTSEAIAVDTLEFLRQFFILFPEYATNPFFLVGHSYGGHFAPAVGTEIHRRNEGSQQTNINFKGIMLLAPWTNPSIQVGFYSDIMHQTGIIDDSTHKELSADQELMRKLIADGDYAAAKDVWLIMLGNPDSKFKNASGFSSAASVTEHQMDFNSFNFLFYVESPEFRQAVHVGNLTYNVLSTDIHDSVTEEFMASKSGHIEELLRAGKYKVIVVTGQMDLTVVHRGVEKMLDELVWSGQNEWSSLNRSAWYSADGQLAGYKKVLPNLSFYVVRNAGHMLIGDQPAWNLELVNEVLLA